MSKERKRGVRLATQAALVIFVILLVSLGATLPLVAVDFVRGDANSDGRVSIADAHFLLSHVFRGFTSPECMDAGDFTDDEKLNITDSVQLLRYLVLGGSPPPSPFPSAGPDPTSGALDCASYGNGAPLEDGGAVLAILDAVATGSSASPTGEEGLAKIRIAVSSSKALGGYSGAIRVPPGVAVGVQKEARDLSATLKGGFHAAGLDADLVRFGFLSSFTDAVFISSRELAPVLELTLCLAQGLSAGEYPLTLEAGELVDFQSGRAIPPRLVSATLTVVGDVTAETECNPPPPPLVPVNAVYRLGDVVGAPGGEVTVPFIIRADAEVGGYLFSVDFDETLLEVTSIEQVWQKPPGTKPEYDFGKTWFDNHDNNPGSGGVDEGVLIGAIFFDFEQPVSMPANTDNVAQLFHFRIKPDAPSSTTKVRFLDGGHVTGEPVINSVYALGQNVTPDVAESFLLIDCLFQILPDGAVFIRGDSNGDRLVDVSDAVNTLDHLFLGKGPILCADAADANDDGRVDISDPVMTLEFLFLGRSALPPPNGEAGKDPTPDELICFSNE